MSLPADIVAKLDRLAADTQRTRSNTLARLIGQQPDPKAKKP